MKSDLDAKIEAILFWRGEPVSLPELCRMLRAPSGEVKSALASLREKLSGRGIALIQSETEFSLATASTASALIQELQKEELSKDLGKAALETLSIILYHAPVSRRDIDYIRGVNSTAILRALLIRGLVERDTEEADSRAFRYRPAVALLALIGIQSVDELPEYAAVKQELSAWSAQSVAENPSPEESPQEKTSHDSTPQNELVS